MKVIHSNHTTIMITLLRMAALCSLLAGSLAATGQKKLRLEDYSYEEQIRTVLFYPASNQPHPYLRPAAASLQQQNLILEFDDIQDNRDNYYLRLVHCTFDWKPSGLRDLDFMAEYNEFPLNTFTNSANTHLPYVHYHLPVPAVKLPGNYVAMVYRNDRSDVVLTRRFLIYDSRARLLPDAALAGRGNLFPGRQQVNFSVDYSGVDVPNPLEQIHVTIRQNQRWDNAKINVPPSFVREFNKQIEYRFFDEQQLFEGGCEFRFVDFRSLQAPGQNTLAINRKVKPYELSVQPDKTRATEAYSQIRDRNGLYIIEDLDFGNGPLTGNYLFVDFALQHAPIQGNVYVVGAFNMWARTPENKMRYNATKERYEATLVLKQGFYDYEYWVESPTLGPRHVEGSHFQTENYYEVLVYYRPFQPQADLLIGYATFTVNGR